MLAISWKALASVVAAAFAGILVFACWPRLEPSALNAKAAVEQPVFVKPSVLVSALKAPVAAAQPLAKEAIGKLASALRNQPAAQRNKEGASPGAALAIPIDDGRRLCAEGLVAFAKGDIATARAFFVSAAEAGDARALVALGDTFDPATLTPSRRSWPQRRWRQGARLLRPRPRRRRDRSAGAACGFGGEVSRAHAPTRAARFPRPAAGRQGSRFRTVQDNFVQEKLR